MASISLVERQKENIKPSQNGYDIRMLAADALNRNEGLEDTEEGLVAVETELESYEDEEESPADDPLAPALQYIDEVEISQIGTEKILQTSGLIAETIEKFQDCEEYKNDPRMVNLCLRYSTLTECPPVVFEFMEARGIGSKCAILYYYAANYFEGIGDTARASEQLQIGLQRYAEPTTLLQSAVSLLAESTLQPPVKKKRTGNGLAAAKKRVLQVYVDDDIDSADDRGSNERTSAVPLPDIRTEKQENKRPADHSLVSTSHSYGIPGISRTLNVYRDTEAEIQANTDADQTAETSQIEEKTYSELALIYGITPGVSLRPFRPYSACAMTVNWSHTAQNSTGAIGKLASGLQAAVYQPHDGVTEPIGNAHLQRQGDTEIL